MNYDELSRSELSLLIDEWIFNERDRAILKRRLLDGLKYEALAEEFDMSVRRTKSIVYKSQERLFKAIDRLWAVFFLFALKTEKRYNTGGSTLNMLVFIL